MAEEFIVFDDSGGIYKLLFNHKRFAHKGKFNLLVWNGRAWGPDQIVEDIVGDHMRQLKLFVLKQDQDERDRTKVEAHHLTKGCRIVFIDATETDPSHVNYTGRITKVYKQVKAA